MKISWSSKELKKNFCLFLSYFSFVNIETNRAPKDVNEEDEEKKNRWK